MLCCRKNLLLDQPIFNHTPCLYAANANFDAKIDAYADTDTDTDADT